MTLLPEAEILRKELEREVVGQRIKEVTVRSGGLSNSRESRGDAPDDDHGEAQSALDPADLKGLAVALEGERIEAVIRQGTNLAFRFKSGKALVIRSGSAASLTRHSAHADGHPERPQGPLWNPKGDPGSGPPDSQVEIVVAFEGGGAFHCLDADRNGPVRLVTLDELNQSPEFTPIGMDPFTNTPTWLEFSRQLIIRNCRLRALLGDDTFVVGLGAVYSDEILWAAGLSGMRSSAGLSAQEVRRLYRAIQEVLHEAVKQARGVSDPADEDLFDDPLARQHLKVYGRAGQSCARCRQRIVLEQIDNPPVSSYFCPNCQT